MFVGLYAVYNSKHVFEPCQGRKTSSPMNSRTDKLNCQVHEIWPESYQNLLCETPKFCFLSSLFWLWAHEPTHNSFYWTRPAFWSLWELSLEEPAGTKSQKAARWCSHLFPSNESAQWEIIMCFSKVLSASQLILQQLTIYPSSLHHFNLSLHHLLCH